MNRRTWLRGTTAGLAGFSMSGWLRALAAEAAGKRTKRSCILLWMNGGPSQMDTFDLKPGHANGGPFKEIATSVPGIKIGEHLPKVAAQMKHLAVVRGMSTKEGDHGRATYLMRNGYLPQGAIEYPTLGSLMSKELGNETSDLPNFVSIAPIRYLAQAAWGPGFLGPQYAPLMVGDALNFFGQAQGGNVDQMLKVPDLQPSAGVNREQAGQRVNLLKDVEDKFLTEHPGLITGSHRAAYAKAVKLMNADAAKAFDLSGETKELRDRYGRNLFGQGCLLARRLVERGVPFVEITLGGVTGSPAGWDTHQNNFDSVKAMCQTLDPAWATLIDDLRQRGMLDSTVVVWMGEFGRTPRINPQKGRDHYSLAWSTVIGGGGIKGGSVIGRTSGDGSTVEERPVTAPDLLATVCKAVGIDHGKQNMSNVGRPIRIVDKSAQPITEVLA